MILNFKEKYQSLDKMLMTDHRPVPQDRVECGTFSN